MSYQDHGAYTPPSEQPLRFDARQPIRGSSPMPTTLIASVVLLAIVAGGGVLLWRHGVHEPTQIASAGGPPTVGAEVGPMRTAAPASVQPQDPTQGLQIYRTEAPQAATPVLVPPPETPTRTSPAGPPQIAVAQAPAESVTLAAPPAPPAAIGAPAPASPRTVVAHAAIAAPAPAAPRAAIAAPAPSPTASAPAAPGTTIDSLVEAARHGAVAQRAALHTAPVATGPSGLRSSVAATLINPPAPRVQAPLTAAASARPAAPAGAGTSVQIGAFSSSALADRGLADAARVAPGAAAGRGRRIEPVSVGGHTLYRTSMTGFSSHATAVAFCDQLRAGGKTCFVR